LNDLLGLFDIELSDRVLSGPISALENSFSFSTGTTVRKFPAGGRLLKSQELVDVISKDHMSDQVVGGLFHVSSSSEMSSSGRIAVFGDSGCLDSVKVNGQLKTDCFPMLEQYLSFAIHGTIPVGETTLLVDDAFFDRSSSKPKRRAEISLRGHSKVLGQQAMCQVRPSSISDDKLRRYSSLRNITITDEELDAMYVSGQSLFDQYAVHVVSAVLVLSVVLSAFILVRLRTRRKFAELNTVSNF